LTAGHLLGGIDVEGIGWKDFVWAIQSVVNGFRQEWGCLETLWSDPLVYKMKHTLTMTSHEELESDVHFPLLAGMTDFSSQSWSFRDASVVDAFLEVVSWTGFRLLPDDQHQDLIFGILAFVCSLSHFFDAFTFVLLTIHPTRIYHCKLVQEETARYPHEIVYISRKVFVCLQWHSPTDPSHLHAEIEDLPVKQRHIAREEVEPTTRSSHVSHSCVSGNELSMHKEEEEIDAKMEEAVEESEGKAIQHAQHSRSVSFNPVIESVEPNPDEFQKLLESVLETFRNTLYSCAPGIWRDVRMSMLKAKESDLKIMNQQYLSLRVQESNLVWNCRSLVDKSYERIKTFPSPVARIRWDQVSEQRESLLTFVGEDLDPHSHEFASVLSYLRNHPSLVLPLFRRQLEQESAYEEDHFIDCVMEELFDEFSCSSLSVISFLYSIVEEYTVDDILLACQKRISTRSSSLVRVLIRMMEVCALACFHFVLNYLASYQMHILVCLIR
jgi:hypothetical protein